jgi:ATP/maltotriose-dependent transcriptional regulator MalT
MLLERTSSMDELSRAVDRASMGNGSVVAIVGEAGIGKTTLLNAFAQNNAKRLDVFWGGCEALFTPRPLGPLQDMAPRLSHHIADLLNEPAAQDRIFPAVLTCLQNLPKTKLLIFEDVHWADNATLDLIKYLGRRISILNMVLVLSLRSDEVGVDHPITTVLGDLPSASILRVTLEPLSLEAVEQLAEHAGHSSQDLYRITGGNPFFVTELLARNIDSIESIPDSVRDAVWSRMARLSAIERELLEVMSVVPSSVEPQLLTAILGPDVKSPIDTCLGRGMILRNHLGALKFRHELARKATLERLSPSRQRTLHAEIQNALSREETSISNVALSRLVHHAAGAEDGLRVLELAPKAATEAARLGAHEEAANHLGTALKYVSEASKEVAAQLYEDWAYEAGLALQIDDSIIAARHSAIVHWRELGRTDKLGLNLRWLSRLHWYRGESHLAADYIEQAIKKLETEEAGAELAMCYSARSQMHMLNDRTDDALHWGYRAISLAEQLGQIETRIHALNNVGSALMFSGREGGPPLMEESLSLALRHGFHEHAARVYTNYAEYAVIEKDFTLAERLLKEGIAFDTKHDLDTWTHYLIGRQAQLRMEQGRLHEAETIARGVMGFDRLTLVMKLPALTVLARVAVRLGLGDKTKLLHQALNDALATGEPQNIVPARFNFVEAAWLDDELGVAQEHLGAIAALTIDNFDSWKLGELATWWQRCEMPMPFPAPYASLASPRAAELRGEILEAADEWNRLGLPYEAGLTLMRATGKNTGQLFARAVTIFETIHAQPAAARTRRLSKNLGFAHQLPKNRRGPYTATRNHPLGLTQREEQILKLVVDGLGNQDIAKRLVRSQRTVEHHVSSLLGKLNANNRMDVMLRLRNEPWLISSFGSTNNTVN